MCACTRAWLHAHYELCIIHIMAKANPPSDLAARINALIDRHFEKKVLPAALAWGIPQPTAYRLAAGLTTRPQLRTLQQIAAYHETTVEWLREGKGLSPLDSPDLALLEYREFRMVVERLNLPLKAKWVVLSLPGTIAAAHAVLCQWGIGYQPGIEKKSDRITNGGLDAMRKASALIHVGWANYFTGLINLHGVARLREKLESEIDRASLGFHPIAMEMLNAKHGPADLGEALTAVGIGQGRSAGTLLRGLPATPAMDAVLPLSMKDKRGRPRKTVPHRSIDDDEVTSDPFPADSQPNNEGH